MPKCQEDTFQTLDSFECDVQDCTYSSVLLRTPGTQLQGIRHKDTHNSETEPDESRAAEQRS